MTVPASSSKAGPYSGNGSTKSFPYGFRILSDTHLRVYLTNASGVVQPDLTVGVDYSVSGAGSDNGGAVTYPITGSPLPLGWKLTILRNVPFDQGVDISNAGGFYPDVHEAVFDKLTMQTQQLKETVDRCVKVDASSGVTAAALVSDLYSARDTAVSAASTSTGGATTATTKAGEAAASAASAAAVVASAMFRDVQFLTFASSPFSVTQSHNGVLLSVDTSGGAVTINLPSIAALTTPFVLGIKKTSSDGNALTINRTATDTIDGGTTKTISSANSGTTLFPDKDPAPYQWTSTDFGTIGGNWVVDQRTGTGSQTAFSLSVAPGSKNNTFVTVGSVPQLRSSYSVSGTTITFSAPPANGAAIEIASGLSQAIGTPADGTVIESKLSFSDVTTGNASTSAHGLLPKLPGNTTTFLRGDGAYAQVGLVIQNHITGFLASTKSLVSNTSATINFSNGQAADSTNAVMLNGTSLPQWSVANGNAANGYQGGTTLPASTSIHFFVIALPADTTWTATFASASLTPTLPGSYTRYRRIDSFTTNASGVLIDHVSTEREGGAIDCCLGTAVSSSTAISATAVSVTCPGLPTGMKFKPKIRMSSVSNGDNVIISDLSASDVAPGVNGVAPGGSIYTGGIVAISTPDVLTNTSAQFRARGNQASTLYTYCDGWVDFRRG